MGEVPRSAPMRAGRQSPPARPRGSAKRVATTAPSSIVSVQLARMNVGRSLCSTTSPDAGTASGAPARPRSVARVIASAAGVPSAMLVQVCSTVLVWKPA